MRAERPSAETERSKPARVYPQRPDPAPSGAGAVDLREFAATETAEPTRNRARRAKLRRSTKAEVEIMTKDQLLSVVLALVCLMAAGSWWVNSPPSSRLVFTLPSKLPVISPAAPPPTAVVSTGVLTATAGRGLSNAISGADERAAAAIASSSAR
jgi:hypothetical protein